jgi:hypothetical protein
MIANAILSVLASSGPLGLGDIRRMLSQFSYAGLRYQLARLQEDGNIERVGDAYRLRQRVDSQRKRVDLPAPPIDVQPPPTGCRGELSKSMSSPQAKHYRELAAGARRDAANANDATRGAYLTLAHQWEGLAVGVEGFVKSETAIAGVRRLGRAF